MCTDNLLSVDEALCMLAVSGVEPARLVAAACASSPAQLRSPRLVEPGAVPQPAGVVKKAIPLMLTGGHGSV